MTSTNTLTATREFNWVQFPWYPTSRHTVPRRRDMTSTVEVSVPIIDSNDAPVAYLRQTDRLDRETREHVRDADVEYRLYDGRLWTSQDIDRHNGVQPAVAATEEWLAGKDDVRSWIEGATEQDARFAYIKGLPEQIIINGVVWTETVEPVYNVDVPDGWSARGVLHTRLKIEDRPDIDEDEAARDHIFPADQLDQAVAYAKAAAEDGHLFDEAAFRTSPNLEATGAHQPGSTWKPAPRITIAMPKWDDTPEQNADALRAVRETISNHHPDLLIKTDDGFGNTYFIVDRSKLSHLQAFAYDQLLEGAGDPAAPRKR